MTKCIDDERCKINACVICPEMYYISSASWDKIWQNHFKDVPACVTSSTHFE